MTTFHWQRDPEFWDARAEHAFVGAFELVAFDIPANQHGPRLIGWELFTGRRFLDLVTKGDAASLDEAKAAAEAAYRAKAGEA